jgi:hypothetical protein
MMDPGLKTREGNIFLKQEMDPIGYIFKLGVEYFILQGQRSTLDPSLAISALP